MTLDSIKASLSMGMKVCYKTSRYEVLVNNDKVYERDVYNGSMSPIDESEAHRCFIKTDWND